MNNENTETAQVKAENQTAGEPETMGDSVTLPAPAMRKTQDNTDWFWSEGVKGDGDKPDWYNDKTFKNISEQAKAQPELRKALGDRVAAPSEYKINLSEDFKDYSIDKEDAVFKKFYELSKESKLSQSQFDTFLNLYAASLDEGRKKFKEDFESEVNENLKEAGLDAKVAKEEVGNYLVNQGVDKETIDNLLLDPYNIRAWNQINKNNVKGMAMPSNTTAQITKDDIVKMKLDKRYARDPEYTNRVQKTIEQYVNQK